MAEKNEALVIVRRATVRMKKLEDDRVMEVAGAGRDFQPDVCRAVERPPPARRFPPRPPRFAFAFFWQSSQIQLPDGIIFRPTHSR